MNRIDTQVTTSMGATIAEVPSTSPKWAISGGTRRGQDEIWVSEGTIAGTDSEPVGHLRECHTNERFVWLETEDGGGNGTVLRRTIATGEETSGVAIEPLALYLDRHAATYDDQLVFTTRDALGEEVLWLSDGTPEGTAAVEWAGEDRPARFWQLVSTPNRVYVVADSRAYGRELWVLE